MKVIAGSGLDGLVGSRFVELNRDQYQIENASLVNGVDITDLDQLNTFFTTHQPTFFIHLAAFTDVNAAFNERGDKDKSCYKVNVLGSQNVAKLCAQFKIPLIHISTDYVFDGTKTTPYTEEDTPHPIEWYGETKALAEKEVVSLASESAILRIAFPYRAQTTTKPSILQKILDGLKNDTLYPQFSDTLITPTFIDDIARALQIQIENFKSGIYHCVGGTSLSNYDLAKKIARHFKFSEDKVKEGSLTTYLENNDRPYHRSLALDNNKFSTTFGFHFSTIDEGLKQIKEQLPTP